MAEESGAMGAPTDGEWWMAIVTDGETGQTYGDLALHLTWGGRTAEVGYTFASEHWGKGYATEALAALVEYLFQTLSVTRITGMLHPDNVRSARVLERTGFVFEAHTRKSFWVDDEVSDDHIYAMLREDWEAWVGRPQHRPTDVALVPVDESNERAVFTLRTHKSQESYVATMASSFADALFPEIVDGGRVVPWMRAIYADGALVGFVMLALATDHHPEPYLWRLLIDRLHQRRGIGSMAMDLVEEECRRMGASTLVTSWVEGLGSPRPFYVGRGFEPTGEILDGETEARKHLV
jgi:RimJ/RimL family protein N-acetyltransferase